MAKSHKKKRLESRFGKKQSSAKGPETVKAVPKEHEHVSSQRKKKTFYDQHYKKLLIIPFIMLIAAILLIVLQVVHTGDFVHKGISLKGGTSITLTADMVDLAGIDLPALENNLHHDFPKADIGVRTQKQLSDLTAIEFEVDIDNQAELQSFKESLVSHIPGLTIEDTSQNVRTSGAALGSTFFSQLLRVLYVAFLFMGMVVFLTFGTENSSKIVSVTLTVLAAIFVLFVSSTMFDYISYAFGAYLIYLYIKKSIPSIAIILAAFSDIVVTLAVINIMGMKLSTAGIAAFLMLIGYSVDTDILLSTRVLKNVQGSIYERIISAMKTGLTMNITTLAAVGAALIFSESQTIIQIMTILFIGLLADMINTWIQNVGLLRGYAERLEKKHKLGGERQ